MVAMNTEFLNRYRVQTGRYASDESYGFNGAFAFPLRYTKSNGKEDIAELRVIASDGEGWEHVSVTLGDRSACPSWEVMCAVKDLFWGPDKTVIQFHPAAKDYVNTHPFCLHLWRPVGVDLPLPSPWLVGIPVTPSTPSRTAPDSPSSH